MKYRKTILIIAFVAAGTIAAIFLNKFIDGLIFPDPCVYHSKEIPTNLLFRLFYEVSSSTGGHPEPTLINPVITLLLGGLLGFKLAKSIARNIERRAITNQA
jgi:hypothetical protein